MFIVVEELTCRNVLIFGFVFVHHSFVVTSQKFKLIFATVIRNVMSNEWMLGETR